MTLFIFIEIIRTPKGRRKKKRESKKKEWESKRREGVKVERESKVSKISS